jgi:hypothetical protein
MQPQFCAQSHSLLHLLSHKLVHVLAECVISALLSLKAKLACADSEAVPALNVGPAADP